MFEGLDQVLAAWRTVAHVSEWTGLSIGALVAIAAVVFYDPRVLKPAIGAVVLVAVGYAGTLYGAAVGRAEIEAQWADARAAAIEAQHDRDQLVEQQLEARYGPRLAELKKQADDNKRRADNEDRKTLAAIAAMAAAAGKGGRKPVGAAGNSCELGDAADRVRPHWQARKL